MLNVIRVIDAVTDAAMNAALGHLASTPVVGATGFLAGGGWSGAIALLTNPPMIVVCAGVGMVAGFLLSKVAESQCEVVPIEMGRRIKEMRHASQR